MNTDADALWYARAVLAETDSHDDATTSAACALIEAQSPDAAERDRARDLRVLIEGEEA